MYMGVEGHRGFRRHRKVYLMHRPEGY